MVAANKPLTGTDAEAATRQRSGQGIRDSINHCGESTAPSLMRFLAQASRSATPIAPRHVQGNPGPGLAAPRVCSRPRGTIHAWLFTYGLRNVALDCVRMHRGAIHHRRPPIDRPPVRHRSGHAGHGSAPMLLPRRRQNPGRSRGGVLTIGPSVAEIAHARHPRCNRQVANLFALAPAQGGWLSTASEYQVSPDPRYSHSL